MPLAPKPDAITLLPTATAARAHRHTYDATQRALGREAWEPAPIYSWPQFLDTLWSEAIVSGIETRLLLNQAQETALWIDIVSTKQSATLTSADSLADLAREAWSLANAYNATSRLRASATTHDSRTFATWTEAFARDCDRNSYLSRPQLESALQHHIEAGTLTPPPTLTLIGFTHPTPAQSNLLEALQTAGTQITEQTLEVPAETRSLITATSEQEELREIAHWLRDFLTAHPESTRIAVLLPTPDDAPALNSIFREILAPELQSIFADASSTPWEFPTGGPLANHPLIATALDLAHWAQSPLELPKVSALLISPYLNSPETLNHSAQFDAQILRQTHLLRPEITLSALLNLPQIKYAEASVSPQIRYPEVSVPPQIRYPEVSTSGHIGQAKSGLQPLGYASPPTWLKPLHQFLTRTNLETPRSFADWAEFLRALLAAASFPTSPDFHATEAWDSLLDQLSTLDFRGRRVPYATYLQTLTRQATTTPFTPPSTNAPIQILTPTSAAAQTFDALILAQATDQNYPNLERTNPLLSFPLQAALNMPGASQSEATSRANLALNQLLTSASNLLVTYTPQTSETHQRLAPLFANLRLSELDRQAPSNGPQIVTVSTVDSTVLPPLFSTAVSGGARVLKLQAACGFLAFSELRLHSTPFDTQSPGFDALESGNFLHKVLQTFWNIAKTQQNLKNLSSADCAKLIATSVDKAINLPAESPWDAAYLDLQKQRLRTVLHNWLNLELERGPFEVIGLEQKAEVEVGPLTLTVRVDRIDRVAEGHLFVDYKTGSSANPSQWEDPRPEEPQLPLYALLSQPGELKGLAFAKVRAGNGVEWLGYQSEPGILPSKGSEIRDMDQAIEDWRHTLSSLAHDFASGIADVNPKDFAKNCKHCAQRLLCRINPESFLASDEPETGDDPE
jgi:ATP-dependent helicase/nuclease subunit B